MWHTPEGNRILTPAERLLFKSALWDMHMHLELEADGCEQWKYGVSIFDDLPWQQRLALLHEVIRALFLKSVKAPMQTAVTEAAIASIYAAIKLEVLFELETEYERGDDACSIRRLIRVASFHLDTPCVRCDDLSEWEFEVDCLQDQVLWDVDWEMADDILDDPPELSDRIHAELTIDRDYFITLPPDPRDCEIPKLWKSFERLIRA